MFAQKTQIVSVRVSAACYVAPPSCIELKRSKRMWEVQSIAYELGRREIGPQNANSIDEAVAIHGI